MNIKPKEIVRVFELNINYISDNIYRDGLCAC